jgi:hypothetical protein
MTRKTYIIAKLLEAIGIAALIIAFVTGIYGDEWGELYLFIGGIITFVIGRQMEKRWTKRNTAVGEHATLNTN